MHGAAPRYERSKSGICVGYVPWHLVLLLVAQFLSIAIFLVPLLRSQNSAIAEFWKRHSLIAVAALSLYALVTLPVAVGKTRFIEKWPLSLFAWCLVVLSIASVVQILSVATDPRASFIGSCCLAVFFSAVSVGRFFDAVLFTKISVFLISIFWHSIVFVFIGFVRGLSPVSAAGAGSVTTVICVFVLSELRIIEMGSVVGLSDSDQRDPFTVSVYINCASWRFMLQLLILVQKLFLNLIYSMVYGVINAWRLVVMFLFNLMPARWWSPSPAALRVVNGPFAANL